MTIVNHFKLYRIWGAFLVFAVFMAIDYLVYGLIKGNPYAVDLVPKAIWTLVFSFAFTAIYNQAATWHPDGQAEQVTKHKIWNGILFSFVMGLMFIAIIACSGYLVSTFFMYVLDGFRGIPDDLVDDGVLVAQTVAGGLVLELHGKDETEERRNGST